jgi:hypothetical protein
MMKINCRMTFQEYWFGLISHAKLTSHQGIISPHGVFCSRERKRSEILHYNLTSFLHLFECISGCGGEVVRVWFGVILELD